MREVIEELRRNYDSCLLYWCLDSIYNKNDMKPFKQIADEFNEQILNEEDGDFMFKRYIIILINETRVYSEDFHYEGQ